jgi:hypothetical protein
MAAGTQPVVTTTVTRPETREAPPFTETEIFGHRRATQPQRFVARPERFTFQTSGDWTGGFAVRQASLDSNTDLRLSKKGAELLIDIRATQAVPSIHYVIDALYQRAVKEGRAPKDLYPAENERVAFSYVVKVSRKERHEVLYTVVRLPRQSKIYTVVVRGEWRVRDRGANIRQMNEILNSLTLE